MRLVKLLARLRRAEFFNDDLSISSSYELRAASFEPTRMALDRGLMDAFVLKFMYVNSRNRWE